MKRKIISILFAMVMVFALTLPCVTDSVLAAETETADTGTTSNSSDSSTTSTEEATESETQAQETEKVTAASKLKFKKVDKTIYWGAVVLSKAVVYEDASKKSAKLGTYQFGKKFYILAQSTDWYKVKRGKVTGYMPKTSLVKYNKTKKHIALTFDDGPSASNTPIVLKALKKNKCRATFFVVGSMINSSTGKLLKQEIELGCEIGNHSYNHPQLNLLSSASIKSQLSKTDKLVKKYTGKKPSICRAPYGAYNSNVLKIMARPNIYWSEDTLDWKYRNTSRLISYVNKVASNGDIILMHDIHNSTAKAVNSICKNLKKKNFEMVTVTELAAIRGKSFTKGKTYFNF